MSIQDQIAEQEATILQLEKAHLKAQDQLDKAETKAERAEMALIQARNRRRELGELAEGKKPYLCGTPYTTTHHGDQYKTTTIHDVREEVRWWGSERLAEVMDHPYPCAYIVALDDDGKTWKALVYLREDAQIKAATLRRLVKLPEA